MLSIWIDRNQIQSVDQRDVNTNRNERLIDYWIERFYCK